MDQPTYKILNTQKDANGRVLLLCFKFMYLGRYIENSEKSYRNYALSQAASFSAIYFAFSTPKSNYPSRRCVVYHLAELQI